MEKLLLLLVLLKLFSLEVLADTQLPKSPNCGKSRLSNLSSSKARIFNGNITDIDEFPWLGRLISNVTIREGKRNASYEGLCTSSLITSNWVLTAGHCVFMSYIDLSLSFISRTNKVTLGEWDTEEDPDCISENKCAPKSITLTAHAVVHPNFYATMDPDYDIALLRLENNVEFSPFIQRMCLAFEPFGQILPSYEGRQVTLTGWGLYDTTDTPTRFKRKGISTVNNTCGVSEQKRICVEGTLTSACSADSGGPLLLQLPNDENTFYQIGVASLGRTVCVNNSKPTTYVRVDANIDWIKETMQQCDRTEIV